jgi:hypothetical protein
MTARWIFQRTRFINEAFEKTEPDTTGFRGMINGLIIPPAPLKKRVRITTGRNFPIGANKWKTA